jgi:hypothetical protein
MQGDLISRSTLIEKLNDTGVQITFDLPVEEVLGADVDMEDFVMLVQDAIQVYRKMIIGEIKKLPIAYDVEKVEKQIDNLEIYFSDDCNDALVVLDDVMECVWNGGKE